MGAGVSWNGGTAFLVRFSSVSMQLEHSFFSDRSLFVVLVLIFLFVCWCAVVFSCKNLI